MRFAALSVWNDYAHDPQNPTTRGISLVYVSLVLLFFTTVAFSLRIYTRTFISRSLGWDDLSITFGVIFAIGLTIDVVLANLSYHWGTRIWDIPLTEEVIAAIMKTQLAGKVLYSAAVFFARAALILFYYRLVVDSGLRWFKYCLHTVFLFNLSVFVAFTVLSIFICAPISGYWTPNVGVCLNEAKIQLANGIVNTFTDALITISPVPLILHLQIKPTQKLGVICLLGLGLMVTAAGALRTWWTWYSLFQTLDTTFYAYPLWIAAAVEVNLAIIAACIPPIRPLYTSYRRNMGRLLELNSTTSLEINSVQKLGKDELSIEDGHASNDSLAKESKVSWEIFTRKSFEVRNESMPKDVEKQMDWQKADWQEDKAFDGIGKQPATSFDDFSYLGICPQKPIAPSKRFRFMLNWMSFSQKPRPRTSLHMKVLTRPNSPLSASQMSTFPMPPGSKIFKSYVSVRTAKNGNQRFSVAPVSPLLPADECDFGGSDDTAPPIPARHSKHFGPTKRKSARDSIFMNWPLPPVPSLPSFSPSIRIQADKTRRFSDVRRKSSRHISRKTKSMVAERIETELEIRTEVKAEAKAEVKAKVRAESETKTQKETDVKTDVGTETSIGDS